MGIIFLVGLVNPKLTIKWGENRSRLKVLAIYLPLFFISFIIFVFSAASAEEATMSQTRAKVPNDQATADAKTKAQAEAKAKEGEKAKAEAKAKEEEKAKDEEKAKAKAKVDAEKKSQADAQAKAQAEAKANQQSSSVVQASSNSNKIDYTVEGYFQDDNIMIVALSPNKESVSGVDDVKNQIIKNTKDLSLVNNDGLALIINFYTDEKAAKLALKDPNNDTPDEDNYIFSHLYSQYNYGSDGGSIQIYDLTADHNLVKTVPVLLPK